MSKAQIAWAASHDWFVRTRDGKVWVLDRYMWGNEYFETQRVFSNFAEMRAWAGY